MRRSRHRTGRSDGTPFSGGSANPQARASCLTGTSGRGGTVWRGISAKLAAVLRGRLPIRKAGGPTCQCEGASPALLGDPRTGHKREATLETRNKSGDLKMKLTTSIAALVLFASVSVADAGLFDFCRHKKCCTTPCADPCAPTCAAPCAPACAAPCAPTCAAPVCAPACAAPACCAPAPEACCAPVSCCETRHCHKFGCGLKNWFRKCASKCKRKHDCCAPVAECCAPVCAPSCEAPCAPTCAAPSCAAPACCN